MVHEKCAVKMVNFMLQADSQQPVCLNLERPAIQTEGPNRDLFRPSHGFQYPGYGKTPLFHLLLTAADDDFWIYQGKQLIPGIRNIHYDQALASSYLWGSQTDAWRIVHGLCHIIRQAQGFPVDPGDRNCHVLEPEIRIFEDFEQSHDGTVTDSRKNPILD